MKRKRRHDRVGKKISTLAHEGVEAPQRVAMALNMERKGRLTPSGGYIRAGSKRRRSRRRRS